MGGPGPGGRGYLSILRWVVEERILKWVLIGFPMGPGDVVGGPQEPGCGFPLSCHPGGPGPAFGGPEFPKFGPMDDPAHGMRMGFPGRPPAPNGMMMGHPPAMMDGSLMMRTAGCPLHLPMARGPTKPMGMPFRLAFGPGRKGR